MQEHGNQSYLAKLAEHPYTAILVSRSSILHPILMTRWSTFAWPGLIHSFNSVRPSYTGGQAIPYSTNGRNRGGHSGERNTFLTVVLAKGSVDALIKFEQHADFELPSKTLLNIHAILAQILRHRADAV